jgi:hypothetical protein
MTSHAPMWQRCGGLRLLVLRLARIGRSQVLYEAGMRTALLAVDPWALARVVLLRGRATGAWWLVRVRSDACDFVIRVPPCAQRARTSLDIRLIKRLKSSFCKGAFTIICAINDHASTLNPVPRTQTSLCLSARYALTPRRAVTRVPSSIDIDIPGTLRLFFVGTRDKNAAEPLYMIQI